MNLTDDSESVLGGSSEESAAGSMLDPETINREDVLERAQNMGLYGEQTRSTPNLWA